MNSQTLKKVLKYLGKYKLLILLSLILSGTNVILTLYVPIILGQTFDNIIDAGRVDLSAVVPLLIKAVLLAGAAALLQWIAGSVNNRLTFGTVRDISEKAFNRIQKLPLSYLDTKPVGEVVSRIISDTEQFSDGLLMGFTQLFSGVVTVIATLAFMISINYKIAIAVALLTPLSLFTAKFIAKRTYSMFKKQSETRGEQTAFIDEMITGEKVVKAFSRESAATENFGEINDRLEKHSLKATFFSSLTNPVTRFINSVVYAVVALVGGLSVLGGGLTVGGLTCLLSYANQYTKPFNEISGVITEIQNAFACAQRVFELIEAQPESEDAAGELTSVSGNVSLKNVFFAYTPEQKLIENFSLNVESGRRVAIVGPTGCGKTTLINLLMRFYDVNSGSIQVENKDIRDVTRVRCAKVTVWFYRKRGCVRVP